MTNETGRNRQQPDYLNERDQAEDREGRSEQSSEQKSDKEREKESVAGSPIGNALRHRLAANPKKRTMPPSSAIDDLRCAWLPVFALQS